MTTVHVNQGASGTQVGAKLKAAMQSASGTAASPGTVIFDAPAGAMYIVEPITIDNTCSHVRVQIDPGLELRPQANKLSMITFDNGCRDVGFVGSTAAGTATLSNKPTTTAGYLGSLPVPDTRSPYDWETPMRSSYVIRMDPEVTGCATDCPAFLLHDVQDLDLGVFFGIANGKGVSTSHGLNFINGVTSTRALVVANAGPDGNPNHTNIAAERVNLHDEYTINCPQGYGPLEWHDMYDGEVHRVYSAGGTVLRLETGTPTSFGIQTRTAGHFALTATQIESASGNAAVAFSAHNMHNGKISVTDVRSIWSQQALKCRDSGGNFAAGTVITNIQAVGTDVAAEYFAQLISETYQNTVYWKYGQPMWFITDNGVTWFGNIAFRGTIAANCLGKAACKYFSQTPFSDVAATSTTGAVPPPTNTPPTVALTAPAAGATFTSPSATVTATAADPDGVGIAKVELRLNGGAWVAMGTTGPGTYSQGVTLPGAPGAVSSVLIEVRATDVPVPGTAALTSPVRSVTVSLDLRTTNLKGPDILFSAPPSPVTAAPQRIVVLVSDPVDGVNAATVQLSLNGSTTWQLMAPTGNPNEYALSVTLLGTPGSSVVNTIDVRAADAPTLYPALTSTQRTTVTVNLPATPNTTSPTIEIESIA